jgi:hypothetical protein
MMHLLRSNPDGRNNPHRYSALIRVGKQYARWIRAMQQPPESQPVAVGWSLIIGSRVPIFCAIDREIAGITLTGTARQIQDMSAVSLIK